MKPLWQFVCYGIVAMTWGVGADSVYGQTPSGAAGNPPKFSPNVPEKITTPDTVETPIGTLRFTDGAPDEATAQLAFDQLDYVRGVEAFLTGMSATSVYAVCKGMEEIGVTPNRAIGISEELLDARTMFFYFATGITPAMSNAKPGTGSAYAGVFRDATGAYLDGSQTYKITLPGPIPAKTFWSFTIYDNQRRSL